MTKKHYIAIARILAELNKQKRSHTIEDIAQPLGEYFRSENPMFNYEQFMRDSGAYDDTTCKHGRNGADLGLNCLVCHPSGAAGRVIADIRGDKK